MSDNFMDVINSWVDETEKKMDDILQTIVIMVGQSVVTLSPVDTGLFKGNWQLSIDTGTTSSLLREDQEGFEVMADITKTAKTFTAGQIAYIQNHVLYGFDLEHGSSPQARDPDGMVMVTAVKFNKIVADAVRLHSN